MLTNRLYNDSFKNDFVLLEMHAISDGQVTSHSAKKASQ